VAAEPVVLLGDVRERPLAGERQRGDSWWLVALGVAFVVGNVGWREVGRARLVGPG